jgi:SulP family sulfate permease
MLLAVLLALLNLVRTSVRPHDAVLALDRGHDVYRDGRRLDDPAYEPGLLVYRVDAPLFFGNAAFVDDRIRGLLQQADPPARWLVLDAEAIHYVDSTATAELQELCEELDHAGIHLAVARMKAPVRARLGLTELADRIVAEQYFPSVRAATAAFRADGAPR